jgi:hypothetical protein
VPHHLSALKPGTVKPPLGKSLTQLIWRAIRGVKTMLGLGGFGVKRKANAIDGGFGALTPRSVDRALSTPSSVTDEQRELREAIDRSMDGSTAEWKCASCTSSTESFSVCGECGRECGLEITDETVGVPDMDTDMSYEEELVNYKDGVELTMPTLEKTSSVYGLMSVVRHIGSDTSSGHYITDVNKGLGHWQRCDDSCVTNLTQEQVLIDKNDAYILFYSRC